MKQSILTRLIAPLLIVLAALVSTCGCGGCATTQTMEPSDPVIELPVDEVTGEVPELSVADEATRAILAMPIVVAEMAQPHERLWSSGDRRAALMARIAGVLVSGQLLFDRLDPDEQELVDRLARSLLKEIARARSQQAENTP